jgi:hypothetical protein
VGVYCVSSDESPLISSPPNACLLLPFGGIPQAVS